MIIPFLYGVERSEQIENIVLILYDKLSNEGTLSTILAPINIFRNVHLFKEPWINSGFECSKDNIRAVITSYFNLLDAGEISEYLPFQANRQAENELVIKEISKNITLEPHYQDNDPAAFIYFIMNNYQGWNADNYDPEKWTDEKAAERKEFFKNYLEDEKALLKTAGGAAAGAVVGYAALKWIIPASIAAYILLKKNK